MQTRERVKKAIAKSTEHEAAASNDGKRDELPNGQTDNRPTKNKTASTTSNRLLKVKQEQVHGWTRKTKLPPRAQKKSYTTLNETIASQTTTKKSKRASTASYEVHNNNKQHQTQNSSNQITGHKHTNKTARAEQPDRDINTAAQKTPNKATSNYEKSARKQRQLLDKTSMNTRDQQTEAKQGTHP